MRAGSHGLSCTISNPLVDEVGLERHDERHVEVARRARARSGERGCPGPAIVVPTWSFETTSARCLMRASRRAPSRGARCAAESRRAQADDLGQLARARPGARARSARGCAGRRRSSPATTRAAARAGRHLSAKRRRLWCDEASRGAQVGRSSSTAPTRCRSQRLRHVDARPARAARRASRGRGPPTPGRRSRRSRRARAAASRRTSIAAPCALTVGHDLVGGHAVVEVEARDVLPQEPAAARSSCARG